MKSTSFFYRLFGAMLMLLGLATTATAQRADDGYRIQQAHYGTARSHVDVTERLRQLAQDDIRFRLGNDTFGVDPAPGQVKTLRIHARGRDRQTRTFEYLEGSIVDGSRFAGWQRGDWSRNSWNGGWGDKPYYTAAAPNRESDRDRRSYDGRSRDEGEYRILQALYGSARNNVDVTERLRELARQDRNVRAGNDSFGVDPAPGQPKFLRIFARAPNGQTQTFEYREGSVVDGTQFSGWSGGNWGRGGGHDGRWGGAPTYSPPAMDRDRDRDRNPPQRNADQGEYQILQARYGTARNHVDVTDRLREMARRDRNLRISNDSFGTDPAPGEPKQLRIFARAPNGQTRTFEFAEGGTIDGAQFSGWSNGNWGRGGHDGSWGRAGAPVVVPGVGPGRPVVRDAPIAAPPAPGRDATATSRDGRLVILRAIYGSGSQTADVTARVRENLYQHNQLQMMVANEDLGTDPAPNRPKTLTITYTLDGGRPQEVRVPESQMVTLP